MRTKSEFLERMSEYGYLKYEQPVWRVRRDAPVDRTPYVSVYKFLKQGLDISVMWDNDSDDPIITLIGGCYNHMKEVIEIVNGTDKDDEDDN